MYCVSQAHYQLFFSLPNVRIPDVLLFMFKACSHGKLSFVLISEADKGVRLREIVTS